MPFSDLVFHCVYKVCLTLRRQHRSPSRLGAGDCQSSRKCSHFLLLLQLQLLWPCRHTCSAHSSVRGHLNAPRKKYLRTKSCYFRTFSPLSQLDNHLSSTYLLWTPHGHPRGPSSGFSGPLRSLSDLLADGFLIHLTFLFSKSTQSSLWFSCFEIIHRKVFPYPRILNIFNYFF